MKTKTLSTVGLACAFALGACSSGNSVESFCDVVADVEANDPTIGLEPGSPEFFEASASVFTDLENAAPDEIRDDVAAMGEVFDAMVEEISSGDEPDLERIFSELEAVEAQSENLDNFIEENCELAIDE